MSQWLALALTPSPQELLRYKKKELGCYVPLAMSDRPTCLSNSWVRVQCYIKLPGSVLVFVVKCVVLCTKKEHQYFEWEISKQS